MKKATASRRRGGETKLLVVESGAGGLARASAAIHARVSDLPSYFLPGDAFVVNDAATIPSSLKGRLDSGRSGAAGVEIEVRLAGMLGDVRKWRAVLFGPGGWRVPTEKRIPPPSVGENTVLQFASGLNAVVEKISPLSRRLIEIKFTGEESEIWRRLYDGLPIQYSYLEDELALYDQQTLFSGPPLAVEPPSASFPLTWEIMGRLQAKGVEIVTITHATGLSNTGDAAIDAALPFPENSRVSFEARESLLRAVREGRRIITAGTGVVRALESWALLAAKDGGGVPENFVSELKIGAGFRPRFVAGLLTGLHEPDASHIELLAAFADPGKLREAYEDAAGRGYLWHEYGDVCLIIPRERSGDRRSLLS